MRGLLAVLILLAGAASAKDSYPPLEVLLSSGETVIGQQIVYPEGTAKVTSAIVAMKPGQKTGWHVHNAPLFAHLMEGELTVDYGKDGVKIYKAGDSLLEAFKVPHNGTNTGHGVMRLIAVFMGAVGTENTVMVPE